MIHILQLLCPQGHRYVAVAWDCAVEDLAGAAYKLGLATAKVGRMPPACTTCGADSFHIEDSATRLQTIEEARPHLEDEAWALRRVTHEWLGAD